MKAILGYCIMTMIFVPGFIGCSKKVKPGRNSSPQQTLEAENKAIVLRWLNEVDKDNFEMLFDELWTRDCKQYMNSSPEPIEYAQFKAMVKALYLEFPVITHEVHQVYASGNMVTARFSAFATHVRDSFGVPATGKHLEWTAIAVFEIEGGKIKTRWEVADMLGLYQQLGMELQIIEPPE